VNVSGIWYVPAHLSLAIGLVLIVLPYFLRYRAGEFSAGYRAPFAEVPLQQQQVLRAQVQRLQLDPPPGGDQVRTMAELMRSRHRDLLTPIGMTTSQITVALTLRDPWFWIPVCFVSLVAFFLIFTILRQIRAGSAFLQRYPRAT
jgi:hypothetical protein